MAALTQARMPVRQTVKNVALPINNSTKVFQGGMCCIDTSAHVATNGAAANANLIPVGEWADTYDNTAGSGNVYVLATLTQEIVLEFWDSDTGGNAVTASNLFSNVYILDDHTVTTSSSGNSIAGRVWMVDATKGIGIKPVGP